MSSLRCGTSSFFTGSSWRKTSIAKLSLSSL
jgi:hypothetical protein